jgi:hypothetical protein
MRVSDSSMSRIVEPAMFEVLNSTGRALALKRHRRGGASPFFVGDLLSKQATQFLSEQDHAIRIQAPMRALVVIIRRGVLLPRGRRRSLIASHGKILLCCFDV